MLKKNKVLTSLIFWDDRLGPQGLHEIFSAVGMNTALTSLDLSWNTLDNRSIASIRKLIDHITSNHLTRCGRHSHNCCCRILITLTLAQLTWRDVLSCLFIY